MNLETLIQYQLENHKYLIYNVLGKILVRKVSNINQCREMLRYLYQKIVILKNPMSNSLNAY